MRATGRGVEGVQVVGGKVKLSSLTARRLKVLGEEERDLNPSSAVASHKQSGF